MNLCTQCSQNFTSLSAFDKHHTVLQDDRGTVLCADPAEIGLEAKYTATNKLRGWGFPATETPYYEKDTAMETTQIRQDDKTKQVFVSWGRGRPPSKATAASAEIVQVDAKFVGQWLGRDGNVYAARPTADKPAKAAPKAKPATAKAVTAVRPAAVVQGATRTAVAVPAPPAAVINGQTTVEALAAGTLAADTFDTPPHAADRFESLYPDEDFLDWDSEIVEPEPDDYMQALLDNGSLAARSV